MSLARRTERRSRYERDMGALEDVTRQAARVTRQRDGIFDTRKHEVGGVRLLVIEDVREAVEVAERQVSPFEKLATEALDRLVAELERGDRRVLRHHGRAGHQRVVHLENLGDVSPIRMQKPDAPAGHRSEERRVGKESRARWTEEH